MSQHYYTVVTNVGLAKEAHAHLPNTEPVQLSEMAIGDGGGCMYEPVPRMNSLKNEVFRTNLNKVYIDPNHPKQLVVEAIIPSDSGGFYIREVGLFDNEGDLFAIGKYPETFKPSLSSGCGKDLYIRMILGFATTPKVNLIVDPNVVLVTVDDLNKVNDVVTDAIDDHEIDIEAHCGAFQGVIETAKSGPVGIHNRYFELSIVDQGSINGERPFAAENVPLIRCDLARGEFQYDYGDINS
jgi:phage-related tail fiber protein